MLGTFKDDTKRIINQELGMSKSMAIDGATQPGSFNLLNTPDSLYQALGPQKFWEQVNKPWLDAAIRRGDDIALATKPDLTAYNPITKTGGNVYAPDGSLTGFGRELDYLKTQGYSFDATTGRMVKR